MLISEDTKQNGELEKEEVRCPDCGNINLIKQGRCITCYQCGWSLCEL